MKAEPRTGFNFDLGSTVPRLSIGAALTLTWRTTKEHQKNGQLRKQPRHHIGKREDPGEEVGRDSWQATSSPGLFPFPFSHFFQGKALGTRLAGRIGWNIG